MSHSERDSQPARSEVLNYLRADKIQIVEQDGVATLFVEDDQSRLIKVLSLEISKGSMRKFPQDLSQAIAEAGYSGEEATEIFSLVSQPLVEFVSAMVQEGSNARALEDYFDKEPKAPALGHMGDSRAIITGVTLAIQRAGLSLFSPAAIRAAQEIVQEDLESYVIGARSRNDVAKAEFMSTQIAKIHQAKGKFGVNSTWVSMYEASAQQNNWPSLETVGGFLTLVNEVYLPIASRLLALPEIASELADVMIEDELADPKHQLEMKIERLSTLLSKAKETSRGGIKVAVIEADASIAEATARNAEKFIEAARQLGYQRGAEIGSIGTAAGETAGNVLASLTALGFRPVDAVERWAEGKDDQKMVTFTLGGFIVAVPLVVLASATPWLLVLGPVAGGAIRQMLKSMRS